MGMLEILMGRIGEFSVAEVMVMGWGASLEDVRRRFSGDADAVWS